MVDLVEREGIYYQKFSDVPFSGKVTGDAQGSVKNGKRDGDWVLHESGQLKKGNFKNGKREGTWISYYDNGQLESKGNYKNGKQEGIWVEYWDDGELSTKGEYKKGKREGAWVSYVFGIVTKADAGTFKDGVKISD